MGRTDIQKGQNAGLYLKEAAEAFHKKFITVTAELAKVDREDLIID